MGARGRKPIEVLAVDPGWDELGLARFRFARPPQPGQLNEALAGFVEARVERGMAGEQDLVLRACAIRALLEEEVRRLRTAPIVVIERPPYEGDYGGEKQRRRGVNRLYMAIGACAAAKVGGQAVLTPVAATSKAERRGWLYSAGLPRSVRGDAADAVWIGAQWVTGPGVGVLRRRLAASSTGG